MLVSLAALIIRALFGSYSAGEPVNYDYQTFRTTQPDQSKSFNDWAVYVDDQCSW